MNLRGGNLLVQGSAAANTAQTIGTLNLLTGGGGVQVASGTGRTATLNIGDIVRPLDEATFLPVTGGSVQFVLPLTGAITTTALLSSGILGAYATVGANWATKSGSNIAAFSTYTTFDPTGFGGVNDNARLTTDARLSALPRLIR